MKPTIYAPFLSLVALAACSLDAPVNNPPPPPAYVTYETLGDSLSIAAKLDEFRAALGGSLNAPNSAPADSGRREINWDGVPAALTNVDTFPASFFNVNSKRGVVFTTPGTGFRIDSTNFAAVSGGLGDQFKFFSPKKLFMPVGSNQLDVQFKLVGTTTPGLVNGFGVVFSDVDRPGSATVEFFDANDVRIGVIVAPNHSSAQLLSFTGAVFPSPVVARVRITSGDAALVATSADVSAGGPVDLVAMDDFVYGEPQPVAGPTAQVTVGNDFFLSVKNGSQNAAVDTITVGSSVTWRWSAAGAHSIQSTGIPPEVFRNSVIMSGANDSYTVTFKHPGTYAYDCAVHGSAMTGRIVVQ